MAMESYKLVCIVRLLLCLIVQQQREEILSEVEIFCCEQLSQVITSSEAAQARGLAFTSRGGRKDHLKKVRSSTAAVTKRCHCYRSHCLNAFLCFDSAVNAGGSWSEGRFIVHGSGGHMYDTNGIERWDDHRNGKVCRFDPLVCLHQHPSLCAARFLWPLGGPSCFRKQYSIAFD
jgi:hypothetical protein